MPTNYQLKQSNAFVAAARVKLALRGAMDASTLNTFVLDDEDEDGFVGHIAAASNLNDLTAGFMIVARGLVQAAGSNGEPFAVGTTAYTSQFYFPVGLLWDFNSQLHAKGMARNNYSDVGSDVNLPYTVGQPVALAVVYRPDGTFTAYAGGSAIGTGTYPAVAAARGWSFGSVSSSRITDATILSGTFSGGEIAAILADPLQFTELATGGGGGGDTTAPAKPDTPTATVGDGLVNVVLPNANTESDLAGYRFTYALVSAPNSQLGTFDTLKTGANQGKTHTFSGLTNGTAYRFWVQAYDNAATPNVSIKSEPVDATPAVQEGVIPDGLTEKQEVELILARLGGLVESDTSETARGFLSAIKVASLAAQAAAQQTRDALVSYYGPVVSATAGDDSTGQAGTLVLGAGATTDEGAFDDQLIKIISGPGIGQTRYIPSYAGAGRECAIVKAWVTLPTSESVVAVYSTIAPKYVRQDDLHGTILSDWLDKDGTHGQQAARQATLVEGIPQGSGFRLTAPALSEAATASIDATALASDIAEQIVIPAIDTAALGAAVAGELTIPTKEQNAAQTLAAIKADADFALQLRQNTSELRAVPNLPDHYDVIPRNGGAATDRVYVKYDAVTGKLLTQRPLVAGGVVVPPP